MAPVAPPVPTPMALLDVILLFMDSSDFNFNLCGYLGFFLPSLYTHTIKAS